MANSNTYRGQCHCGAIRGAFVSTRPAAELQPRACQCSFCTRHGAMTVSDPAGSATLDIEQRALRRYQFGTRTGTSIVCGTCGTYAGVILEDEGKVWSTLNVRGLAIAEFAGRQAEAVAYDGETPAQRIARRKARWTPTHVIYR